jgi:hypothetical protein
MNLLFALSTLSPASAEELTLPMPSPRATVSQQVGVIEVTLDYSSPAKKDRTVWGDLVPYDKLWRTGANAVTTLETSGPLVVGDATVPAGKYALFTIPGKDEWTLILNQDTEQDAMGSEYDQGKDAARVKVKPVEAPARERLTFLFSDTTDTATRLDLEWAGTRVSLPITVDTTAQVKASIDAWVEGTGGTLARAARYRGEQGDLPGALTLIDASIALEETWYNTWIKADLLHRQGSDKAAYALAQRAMELGTPDGEGFFWKARVEKALAEWKKK